jgi:hypothetical protein
MNYKKISFLSSCLLLCLVSISVAQSAASKSGNSCGKEAMLQVNTVKSFLKWYNGNYTKANVFAFTGLNQLGNYIVDQASCEQYLQFLKSSGYISDTYVLEWRKFFQSKTQYFKEFPQNEGPPYGFDVDLVLLTQEPELILEAIDKLKFKIKQRSAKTAIVEVVGEFSYDFELSWVKGKWKIDYISTMNYD